MTISSCILIQRLLLVHFCSIMDRTTRKFSRRLNLSARITQSKQVRQSKLDRLLNVNRILFMDTPFRTSSEAQNGMSSMISQSLGTQTYQQATIVSSSPHQRDRDGTKRILPEGKADSISLLNMLFQNIRSRRKQHFSIRWVKTKSFPKHGRNQLKRDFESFRSFHASYWKKVGLGKCWRNSKEGYQKTN
ncbi:hypothetical protein BLNAU_13635 [Blattamonas nauphoetae]|uniref:Uncharacterized protein n=1 Tax=Blattamonas nauphoetae TaxID=2049346 RepID=A0ABQ9XG88_9EUKA|nr:hypothetical protein BLNAU_13635 [Blattamonas nauphoetae]